MNRASRTAAAGFISALFLMAQAAQAQNGDWINLVGGDASGSWPASGNWSGGVIANGGSTSADFSTLDLTALSTVTLDGARTIGNIIFGDTTPSANWVLNTGTAGPLTLEVTAGTPTITVNNQMATIGAVLTGTSGFNKEGTGTLRLVGANTLSGIININAGILQVDNNSALNSAGNSASTDRTVIASGATLEVISLRQQNNEHITVSGTGVGGTNGAIYANVGTTGNANTRLSIGLNSAANPAVTLVGDTTIRVDGAANSTMLIGHITGGDFTLTKTGGADLRIDPATGYSGGNLHIMEGVLTFGNINGILSTQTVTVDFGATLNLRNNNGLNSTLSSLVLNGTFDLNARGATDAIAYNRQVGTLSGSGLITNGAAATQTFQISSAVADSTFNGTIQTKSANGFINLVKNGDGTTLRLNGNNNQVGTNTVNAGTLVANGVNIAGFNVNSGILGGTGTLSGVIVLNGTGILAAGDPSGTLTVSNVVASGAGTDSIIVSNANLKVGGQLGASSGFVGSLYLTNGTLEIPLRTLGPSAFVSTFNVDGSSTIKFSMATPLIGQFPIVSYTSLGGLAGFSGLSLVSPAGIIATLSNNTANSTIDVVLTGIPAFTWTGTPNGTWGIGSTNWQGGVAYTEPGGTGPFVIFDDSAPGATTVNLATTLSPQGVTVNNSNRSYTFSGSGKLGGAMGIAKQGSNTLTVVNSGNDFTGGVNLNQGTVQVGNGGTTGDLGSGPIANLGTLVLNRSDSFALANTVSGSGAIIQAGAGTATVPVSGDLSGAVTVNAGALALAPSSTSKLSGDVTGIGSFGVNGAGRVVLAGLNNTYSGGTLITSGTLQFGDELGSGGLPPAGNITNHGTLATTLSGTLANNISGSGGVTILNNGSITLSGANSYSGSTVVEGTLTIDTAGAMPATSVLTLGSLTGGSSSGVANFSNFNPALGGLRAGGLSSSILLNSDPQTLTVNGNLTVGNTPVNSQANLNINGPRSTLAVITNGGTIQLGLGNAGSGANPDNVFVDLSGLGNFYTDLGPLGVINMGTLDGNPGPGAGATAVNVLKLAALSNSISAGTITIGAGGRQLIPELRLGTGTNLINSDTLNIGTGGRDGGQLLFDTATGRVTVRGYAGGSSRANLNLGVNLTSGTGASVVNTLDLTGHEADLLLGTLVIGNYPIRIGGNENTFSFNQGVLNASSVSLSAGKLNNANPGNSTMNIGGGTANLGPVSLTASTASGTLNITGGGSVAVNSGITDTGAGVGSLNISGASLSVTGAIGTAASRIDFMNVNNATLNVSIVDFGNPTSAPVQVTSFSADGFNTVGFSGLGFTVGQFPLISYSTGGGFELLTLNPPAGVTAFLSNNVANRSVDVVITAVSTGINPNPTNITVSVTGNQLSFSWPSSHLGWLLQSNAVSITSTGSWFTVPGSSTTNQVILTFDPAKTSVFFRMQLP